MLVARRASNASDMGEIHGAALCREAERRAPTGKAPKKRESKFFARKPLKFPETAKKKFAENLQGEKLSRFFNGLKSGAAPPTRFFGVNQGISKSGDAR
jgi:hypothetical protein